jgi:hypothetical protein
MADLTERRTAPLTLGNEMINTKKDPGIGAGVKARQYDGNG